MKKILSIFCAVLLVAGAASAQSTTPRFGITPNTDNTGRTLTYKWVAKTDAVGNDTLKFVPNGWQTILRLTLTDSLGVNATGLGTSYAGDNIKIIATGASGTKVTFKGANWQTAGTATLSTGGAAVINLTFSGTKWVESGRVVQ